MSARFRLQSKRKEIQSRDVHHDIEEDGQRGHAEIERNPVDASPIQGLIPLQRDLWLFSSLVPGSCASSALTGVQRLIWTNKKLIWNMVQKTMTEIVTHWYTLVLMMRRYDRSKLSLKAKMLVM